MDNKFNQRSSLDEHDLIFTKEDRIETFKKIQEKYQKKQKHNTNFLRNGKRYTGPILGTVMVLLLAIGLVLPHLYSGNKTGQLNTKQASQQEDISFSVLLLGEDSLENSNHRTTIHILLTYNSRDHSMKLVPIPREAYVQIFNSEGKVIGEDKLTHAYAINSTPVPVLASVSDLVDVSIDYYSVIPEEEIYAEIGIDKEEARENRIQIYDIAELIKERLSFSQIKNLIKESETNIPSDIFNQFQTDESNSKSIQVINMEDGVEEKFIDGIYYLDINPNLLETTTSTLKQHLGEK
ncbi:LCP family glycopolymer transferase [Oceanobacillus salinisoli]|uniref:LCP family glycopolymer transferase n=1 Tax=Oceanobacillus salinisoli TaxID=2678611 RepID=UPI0012E109C3|nr:LCP family protein [Oceanobacillus salinisoli]